MSRPLLRYLFIKLLPGAFLINAILNVIGALLICGPGRTVPMHGSVSVARDTMVSSFLVGFVTVLTVTLGTRREVWSGRVPGWDLPWLSWLVRRPLLSGLGLGLLTIACLGLPSIAWLDHRGALSLGRTDFILFKAGFASVAGILTAAVVALVAIAPEPAVADHPGWCREPGSDGLAYPFDRIDKSGLAMTHHAQGCSGASIWLLVVEGRLDPEDVRRALLDLVARCPTLTTRVQSLDGVPLWASRFRYAHNPAFRVEEIFRVVDPAAIEALTSEELNRPLDLFTEHPLTVTLALTGASECRLYFRHHQSIADGRAFIDLLSDFAGFLNAAREGRRPSTVALLPLHRQSETDALALPLGRRAVETVAGCGALIRAAGHALLHPVVPLFQSCGDDHAGENGTIHWTAAGDMVAGWNTAGRRLGVSLDALLTGALFAAAQRWARAEGQPVGRTNATLAMETRPRDGEFVSFANHLATLVVELPLDRIADPVAMVQAVQRQLDGQHRNRTPIKRLLFERQLFALLPLTDMRRLAFTHNLSFSNLIPLGFPALGGAGWRVRDLRLATPALPKTGLAVTAIEYDGRVTFSFNYKSSTETLAQAESFARAFAEVLAEVAGRKAALPDEEAAPQPLRAAAI